MKIAIAGYGVEGEANYRYWNTSEHDVTIVDEHDTPSRALPDGATTLLGEGVFAQLNGFDMVVRTAGLSPHKIVTDGKVWSSTNEFMVRCPAPIIGVTGTKGKGTTASLITAILKADGRTVHLVGNIGTPPLDVLPTIQSDDIVVFEMSSFQLWDVEKSPQTAVVLLIEPDHLNVHEGMDDYVAAKRRIRQFQGAGDLCVYHPTNELAQQIAQSNISSQPVRYGVPDDGGVYAHEGYFMQNEQQICSVDELQLIGAHNVENACAALTVARASYVSTEAIVRGLNQFTGLPHRLEFVRQVGGVEYYNDSFSSAPSATVAAVKSFTSPEIVIVGGVDKGADFTELTQTLRSAPNLKHIVLVGTTRTQLAQQFAGLPVTVSDALTMPQIVAQVAALTSPGDTVLLSPASASFDMFKNFYDRGDQFRAAVQAL